MEKVIKQVELAHLAGVKPPAAFHAFHGKLRGAQTPDGKRLYLDHPDVQAYIHGRHVSRGGRNAEPPAVAVAQVDPFAQAVAFAQVGKAEALVSLPVAPAPQLPALLERQHRARTDQELNQIIADTGGAIPRDLEDLGAIPLRELLDRYGTLDGLATAVKASKQFAEMKHREAETMKKRGDWIARDFVTNTLIGLIDLAFTRCVGEAPTALAEQVIARVMSGGAELGMDVEAMIREEYSGILTQMRDKFVKDLKANG